jgi:hypothetical protein
MPGGVERNPQLHGQLLSGKRLIPLELGQYRTTLALVAYRVLGLDLGERGTHVANVK